MLSSSLAYEEDCDSSCFPLPSPLSFGGNRGLESLIHCWQFPGQGELFTICSGLCAYWSLNKDYWHASQFPYHKRVWSGRLSYTMFPWCPARFPVSCGWIGHAAHSRFTSQFQKELTIAVSEKRHYVLEINISVL